MTDIVQRLRTRPLYEGHGEESSLPEQAADTIEALQARVKELEALSGDSTTLYVVLADIREQSGVGAKPMLSELAHAVGERIYELEEIASVAETRAKDRGNRIRALEEALRPFADVADTLDSETEGVADEDEVQLLLHDYLLDRFTVYLFRRARDVLKGEG